jgi:hypothetical protein
MDLNVVMVIKVAGHILKFSLTLLIFFIDIAQGVSVGDLIDRVKRLESDSQHLAPLKELDVRGELAEARSCIDKLQRQVAVLQHDQEESRFTIERRVQALEAKTASSDARIAGLDSQIEELRSRNIALLEELRQSTREAVADVIDRVAEQFEALQAALDEAVGDRAADAKERAAAARLVGDALAAQRQWTEEQLADTRTRTTQAADAAIAALASSIELFKTENKAAITAMQEKVQIELQMAAEVGCNQQDAIDDLRKKLHDTATAVTSLAQDLEITQNKDAESMTQLKQAVQVWQQGLEEKLVLLGHKFDQYRGYVKKLRKEVGDVRVGQEDERNIAAVRNQKAQSEVAAMLKELEGVVV